MMKESKFKIENLNDYINFLEKLSLVSKYDLLKVNISEVNFIQSGIYDGIRPFTSTITILGITDIKSKDELFKLLK